jgi:hypothetical protein
MKPARLIWQDRFSVPAVRITTLDPQPWGTLVTDAARLVFVSGHSQQPERWPPVQLVECGQVRVLPVSCLAVVVPSGRVSVRAEMPNSPP